MGIPYQAVLRNADGSIMVSSSVGLTFMIHDGAATGTVVYEEAHALTTNAQGLVSCVIGNGVVSQGNFQNINWGSGSKFLHIQYQGTNGTVDLGTQQMMSVPYALYAAQSGTSGPQGPAGPQGVQGPQGIQGATGPQGPMGLTGATGPQGPMGLTGAIGPQGIQGEVGPQGPIGMTGASGPQGETGPQGPTGLTGATGPQGPTGILPDGSQAGSIPFWDGVQWVINGTNLMQQGSAVVVGNIGSDSSAVFQVNALDKGVLLPRITMALRDQIVNPAIGLLVFQTDNIPGFYFFDGTMWKLISSSSSSSSGGSDIKTLLYLTNGF